METVELPQPKKLLLPLTDAILERNSYYGGSTESPASIEELGTLLGTALGKKHSGLNRHYPSGGALYPIETYVITNSLGKFGPSVFHYNPTSHALEMLWEFPDNLALKELVPAPADLFFSTLVIFTSVWKRSSAKYGDFTYTVALLEAGHMSENILLVSTALGLRARPMAGFNDELICKLLDLDSEEEQPVHTIALSH